MFSFASLKHHNECVKSWLESQKNLKTSIASNFLTESWKQLLQTCETFKFYDFYFWVISSSNRNWYKYVKIMSNHWENNSRFGRNVWHKIINFCRFSWDHFKTIFLTPFRKMAQNARIWKIQKTHFMQKRNSLVYLIYRSAKASNLFQQC